MINYYKVLGVKNFASAEEIKIAYRKLSKKLHPDVNEGDTFFTEKFKELQEAFDKLSNPNKKSKYDMQLRDYLASLNNQNTYRSTNNKKEETNTNGTKQQESSKTTNNRPERKTPIRTIVFSLIIFIALGYGLSENFTEDEEPEDNYSSSTEPSQDSISYAASSVVESTKDETDTKLIEESIINDRDEISSDNENADTDYFTVGSTKEEVLKVQGDPISTEDHYDYEKWIYPNGTVNFANGKVKNFTNPDKLLKIKLIDESERTLSSDDYFTVGSTKEDVLKVQGDPSSTEDHYDYEKWIYPNGTVNFANGKVKNFTNPGKQLKVKLINESERTSSSDDYFTIGSTKKRVLQVQGDPISTEDHYDYEKWIYPNGTVNFANGKVKNFTNPGKQLKVKF